MRRICARRSCWPSDRVRQAAAEDPALRGMGTTLVGRRGRRQPAACPCRGFAALSAQRRGSLRCLTRDHSVLREQWDAGMIDAGSPGAAHLRGLLTRAVGVDDLVEPDVGVMRLEPEDIYLLCSDGLTDMVPDAAIAEVLATLEANPPLAAEHLIDLANDRGAWIMCRSSWFRPVLQCGSAQNSVKAASDRKSNAQVDFEHGWTGAEGNAPREGAHHHRPQAAQRHPDRQSRHQRRACSDRHHPQRCLSRRGSPTAPTEPT